MAQDANILEPSRDSTDNFDKVDTNHIQAAGIRQVPDSIVTKLKNDDAYWYANLAPQKKKVKTEQTKPPQKTIFDQQWFRTLIWALIIVAFITVLIWYLASSNINLFKRPSAVIYPDESSLDVEDIFAVNYDEEIKKAVESQNYRLAIRLHYLRTLKVLADNNIIDYKHERTNSDYLFQLTNSAYYKDFFRLTRDFEYTWYGKFDLSSEAYAMIQQDFSSFKQRIQ
jgi:hypothetical protein